jgi:nucleotide-binding universal stress UspA family protein
MLPWSDAGSWIFRRKSDSVSLLSAIEEEGAGLLVTGAYGRHRPRQLLPGGMICDILDRTTVPVLMS